MYVDGKQYCIRRHGTSETQCATLLASMAGTESGQLCRGTLLNSDRFQVVGVHMRGGLGWSELVWSICGRW